MIQTVATKKKIIDMMIADEIVGGVIDLVSVDIDGSVVELVVVDWMDVGPWVAEK